MTGKKNIAHHHLLISMIYHSQANNPLSLEYLFFEKTGLKYLT